VAGARLVLTGRGTAQTTPGGERERGTGWGGTGVACPWVGQDLGWLGVCRHWPACPRVLGWESLAPGLACLRQARQQAGTQGGYPLPPVPDRSVMRVSHRMSFKPLFLNSQ
jgi:hypothetical protein